MASFLSTPIIAAENAIAASADFRTWCGASSEADAKANYIFSDDAVSGEDVPQKFAAISELYEAQFERDAEGAGQGSFNFANGKFNALFSETFDDLATDWTDTNRIAFKDAVAGFIIDLVSNFEGAGQRIQGFGQFDFGNDFTMRFLDPNTGRKGYQYGWIIETGVID